MKKILLAEDDLDLGALLKQFLELNNFEIVWAKDGKEALSFFKTKHIDFCILDVMMPKMDGFKLAEEIIKIKPETLFFFLTAKVDMEDKLKGLKLGANDYITKPFDTKELILRINNIFKRVEDCTPKAKKLLLEKPVNIGDYVFDSNNFTLKTGTEEFRLTEKEAVLISFLAKNKGQVIKRDDILNAVWGTDDYFTGRSMDVFISRLRKYFKYDSKILIKSIRGVGFQFQVN